MTDDQIIVVGVSEEQKKILPSKIIAYNRTNSVDELRKLYAIADIFMNPTYEDNFPTTNIEALACGTPVITYDTGGSPEATGAEVGVVIQRGDLKQLMHSCQALYSSQYACQSQSCSFT